ncbi:MAG TPA: hypothetical protein ENG83_15375 [Nitrospirae bacterium]|nr:polysaccharide biosynthesis/export protein [bacterium BMS3Abin06]HDH13550.1 hypothetical protein [Nitrospirota bacterium]HDZ01010.1 hypothetical protein [Nitrospirota bacterium]
MNHFKIVGGEVENFKENITNPVKKFAPFRDKSLIGFGCRLPSNWAMIVLPVFLLITTLFVTQTLAGDAEEAKAKTATIVKGESGFPDYTIDMGDVLYISVWEEADLRQEVIVRPDGKISFPLAGEVPAFCLTFDQLREELSKRLSEYIRYPIVSISLRKMGGKKVIVLGEVNEPGVYSVSGKRTVLESIALANGFTPHAVPSSVILVRGGLQTPEGMRLDLSRAINKTDMSQNITLQSEDMVYVPKKFIADVNYYVDQILSPIAKGVWTLHGLETLD